MRPDIILAGAAAVILLAGCATSNHGIVLDAVGPVPGQSPAPGSTSGTLVVYSAYEVNADFNCRDPCRHEYSNYEIVAAAGDFRRRVQNDSGTIFQRPRRVALPAGDYRVMAQANGYGLVTVPVIIAAGRDTVVHLESGIQRRF